MSKVADAHTLEVLMLGLGPEVFAIEATCVREILDPVPVTAVPNARPFVDGVINVRGKVVPLADLRLLFGMPRTPPTQDTRVVVIEADLDGEPTLVGLTTDKVYEVTELAAASLEEVPRVGMRWRPELVRCIGLRGDGFVIVPDIARLLAAHAA
ncbi:chemotaxis protein CheW [Azospirillum sp. TSO22-1]|uniref:chemotaxis protein CheW n=1 Tax=Azospirillum sp. TSO22-1 TaxID=716789 RepID=UPI000D61DF3A|nr:chemotaxis protein CheW [Azospirillum sp. TSO22-1]PWC31798.1 chemotaxis protein CheW [Azospirillum sp. TSO22-1]